MCPNGRDMLLTERDILLTERDMLLTERDMPLTGRVYLDGQELKRLLRE